MVRKSSTPEAAVAPQAPAKPAATPKRLDRLPGIPRDGYQGTGETPPPQEDVGATVSRLRKIQATAPAPKAPSPPAPAPVPVAAAPAPAPVAAAPAPPAAPASTPAPIPAAPQPAANGNRIVDQPARRDGSGWKSPQSDGGWRSPGSDSSAPAAPSVWTGNEPAGGGPSILPPPPPPTYNPPIPTYPQTSGGYQSPRSDGGYASPGSAGGTTVSGTPSASGSVSKNEALIVGGVLAAVGLLGGSLISTGMERQIGAQAASEALRKYPQYRGDPRVQQYVQGVVDRLAVNRERKDIKYEIRVVESNEPNAFAVPGGYMFITTAALKQMRNEAELAGVLGHEMAHVEKRHGIKTLQTQLVGMGIAIAALGQTDSQAMQTAGAVALGLAMQGFSREHEHEADGDGCRLAAKGGYDPRGLVSFLETLKAQEHPKVELLSDHPTTEKRIKALNAQIQKESLLTVQMETGDERYGQQVYWLRRGY